MFNNEIQYCQISQQLQIAYTESGEQHKTTLLFVHGLGNYLRVWELNTIELQKKFHCIAIDLIGNGHSSRGDFEFSIDWYANTIIQFIEAKQLKNVVLVGHSMGGQIAMYMGLKYKLPIKKLILVASAGLEYFTPLEVSQYKQSFQLTSLFQFDEMNITQAVQSSFLQSNFITEKIVQDLILFIQKNDRTQYRKMLEKSVFSMLDTPIFMQLKKIEQPTLIIFGKEDKLIPNVFFHATTTQNIAENAFKEMKQATLKMILGAGHFTQMEKAKEVNEIIQEWLLERE